MTGTKRTHSIVPTHMLSKSPRLILVDFGDLGVCTPMTLFLRRSWTNNRKKALIRLYLASGCVDNCHKDERLRSPDQGNI